MKIEHPQYFGKLLLSKGFRVWFKYMFKLFENKSFIEESLHEGLFQTFENIYNQKLLRVNINIPPRSGKTTQSKYFIAYCLAKNPKSNFIYTSFSQGLLADIAKGLKDILEHPIYKVMYDSLNQYEDIEDRAIDNFWSDFIQKETGKPVYTSRKITTKENGTILFASIGSAITGFGAGIRNSKEFSGALILDDLNKPIDVKSEIMRSKVLDYYEETLLSRLNDSNVPIINIQQRLHLEDISGFLIDKYNFYTLKRPLISDDGICQLPSQYDEKRLKEIQINNYMFLSQYQQEPIKQGGTVIKSEWFRFYDDISKIKFTRIFATGDTAQKTKEHNDFSVFGIWGLDNVNLYLIDLLRGKWEAPDLLKQATDLWNRYKGVMFNGRSINCMYIEDKSSGTGLIQTLKVKSRIPIIGIKREVDKLTRLEDVLPIIESGRVHLPKDEHYSFNPVFLSECEAFTRNNTHKFDDIIDNLIDACNIYSKGFTQGDLL